jgi:photosystem II stability/assembly factor-like uncharacterized protein
MPIEGRLREAMRRAAPGAAPSEHAWGTIQRRVDRRNARARALRVSGALVIVAAFVSGVILGALALRGQHQVVQPPNLRIEVSHVRVFAQHDFAKVGGVITNDTNHAIGASISCGLRDAADKPVGTVMGGVPFIKAGGSSPDQTIAAGSTKGIAASAVCSASVVAPAPPPAPAPPNFWPAGVAFFDRDHGLLVGRFGTSGCDRGCTGRIETTSDGGRTWTRVATTKYPLVSVAVFGSSDAWAVENDACAYICPALLHSTDGGRTWKDLGQVNVTDPSFVSPSNGFALGYQRNQETAPVVTTSDGGRTWTQLASPCGGLRWAPTSAAISFPSAERGWLMCEGQGATDMAGKALFETLDGGRTWSIVAAAPVFGAKVAPTVGTLSTIGYLPGMQFTTDGHGWLWLERGGLDGTTDGGRTWRKWSEIIQPDVSSFAAALFVSDTTGYAILFQQPMELLRTDDGGHTWSILQRWRQRS